MFDDDEKSFCITWSQHNHKPPTKPQQLKQQPKPPPKRRRCCAHARGSYTRWKVRMKRAILLLHRAVVPFVACQKMPSAFRVSSSSPSSSSSEPFVSMLELQDPQRSTVQARRHHQHNISSSADKRPLLWQDYFPDSPQWWDCDINQGNFKPSDTKHKFIKESLGIDGDHNLLTGIKDAQKKQAQTGRRIHNMKEDKAFSKQQQESSPEGSHVVKEVSRSGIICRASSGLGVAGNASRAQPPRKGNNCELLNTMDALGMLDQITTPPSADDFICILQKCKKQKDLALAKRVHAHIRDNGLETHRGVGNHLVPMYVECGSVADAQQVFSKLVYRNVHSWTSLIAGYIQCGELLHSINLYEKMQVDGIPPSSYTLVALLKACAALKDLRRGQEIHTQIVQNGFERDVIVGSTLIDMYAKFCLLLEARTIFDKMPARNVVAWSALTGGYAEHGQGQAALKCFEEMQVEGVFPNNVTFVCILKACGGAGVMNKGQEIHTEIIQKGLETDVFVGNTLIDMYAKCGSLSDARNVFDKLPVRDVASWNAMIQGYSMNHDSKTALCLFENMQSQGVKPDAITFACILSACGRANLVLKGQELFKVMREAYGIVPTIDHFTCMVDLLARAGQLCEAEKLLESSPCSPSKDMWRALLSACKKFAEAEIGQRCFRQLVQMNPECAAPYVLMGNIYASAGRWDDAIRIEELRKLAGAKKKAASALIEVNKKVHEFVVGSNQSKEMSSMLGFLVPRAADKGHVPNLDLVVRSISDEQKEAVLCEHVEKLAIAFGLLYTPPGETIRVTKNMRMCNDCHNTSKIISRVEKREIIVRDIYCVHHFKDGFCSCADACIS